MTTTTSFFLLYQKAQLNEIRNGRLAHLSFHQRPHDYTVAFDLKRRFVVVAYKNNDSKETITDVERNQLNDAIEYEMATQEDFLSGLSYCAKCAAYYTTTPCLC